MFRPVGTTSRTGAWRERSSRCNRKASLFEDGDEADTNKPTRCLLIGIPPLIVPDMEYESRHATCCWGEPAHAHAGNEWVCTLTLTLTHLPSPPSSALACHDRTPPAVAATGESGRWPGPLLTVLDACECHSKTEGNTERIRRTNPPHPHFEGRRCVSEPVSSQPGESTGWIPHGGIFALQGGEEVNPNRMLLYHACARIN